MQSKWKGDSSLSKATLAQPQKSCTCTSEVGISISTYSFHTADSQSSFASNLIVLKFFFRALLISNREGKREREKRKVVLLFLRVNEFASSFTNSSPRFSSRPAKRRNFFTSCSLGLCSHLYYYCYASWLQFHTFTRMCVRCPSSWR